jgi:hypothetical protein
VRQPHSKLSSPLERDTDKLRRIQPVCTAPATIMMYDERQETSQEARRAALLRALAIVQRYQDQNWRRLRVNDICTDIKRLLTEEANR